MLARYELIAEIASGGMGVVLLARTAGAGGFRRMFAVKIMHPHLVEDTQFVSMLLDEARVAARIHHPNVVPTVDISQHANLHFLVMDYVEGFQLGDILGHPGFSPPDRLRLANRILLDAMSGLEAAHNLQSDDGSTLGIVHRDVSPQNILVGVDGVGRLTDFGIAFALSRITASRPGIIKGKPAYMAPEQALGNHVDRRADIWALGVMLWEAMTGQRLFVADTDVGTILKVLNDPIPMPRAIVPELPAEARSGLHARAGARSRSTLRNGTGDGSGARARRQFHEFADRCACHARVDKQRVRPCDRRTARRDSSVHCGARTGRGTHVFERRLSFAAAFRFAGSRATLTHHEPAPCIGRRRCHRDSERQIPC